MYYGIQRPFCTSGRAYHRTLSPEGTHHNKEADGMATYDLSRTWASLYPISGKMSYREISWSVEGARFRFRLLPPLWNLTGTSAAALHAEMPVKFQSDVVIIISNLAASRLHEIWR